MRWRPAPRRHGAAAWLAGTAIPGSDVPWREAAWCVVDLELTGLDRSDEIIAIGAVPVIGGAIQLGEAMYTLARPDRAPAHGAVLVHKLRSADLAGAPPLSDAIEQLMGALRGRVPVFHTAVVERTFLGRELRRRRVRLAAEADTEALGRLWLRERGWAGAGGAGTGGAPAGLSLARLMSLLGLPGEAPHHALGDALTTAEAFIALASHLEVLRGPQTVGSLRDAQAQLRGVRRI
ncbi:MAG: 3'-5' exonuclease [Solirubrobacteraceae bacterium]